MASPQPVTPASPRVDLFELERGGIRGVDLERLFEGSQLTMTRWHCHEPDRGSSGEKVQPCHVLVFVHGGSFRQRDPRGDCVADANQVLFYNANQPYETSHPCCGGDHGSGIALSEACLRQIVAEVAPALEDLPGERMFPRTAVAVGGPLLRQHRQRVALLERGDLAGPVRHLGLEEEVVGVVASCIELLATTKRGAPPSSKPGRPSVVRERVQAVQEALVLESTRRWRLEDLSERFGISMFRLCRDFRAVTGTSIHQYLLRARLAIALERLSSPSPPQLTELALELGFDSHSHFTATFRRAFGAPPSTFRGALS
jgi:AraC family transcriptional regulator